MSDHKPTRGIAVAGSMVWMDQTFHSTINICEVCGLHFGPFPGEFDPTKTAENKAREHHAHKHPTISPWTVAKARELGPCTIEDCERKLYQTDARGQGRPRLCHSHYNRWRRQMAAAAAAEAVAA